MAASDEVDADVRSDQNAAMAAPVRPPRALACNEPNEMEADTPQSNTARIPAALGTLESTCGSDAMEEDTKASWSNEEEVNDKAAENKGEDTSNAGNAGEQVTGINTQLSGRFATSAPPRTTAAGPNEPEGAYPIDIKRNCAACNQSSACQLRQHVSFHAWSAIVSDKCVAGSI